MTTPAPLRRRWFWFLLSTLFVVLTIFGVWLAVQVKWIRERRECIAKGVVTPSLESTAPWSLRILGESGHKLLYVPVDDKAHLTSEEMRVHGLAQSLFPEAEVTLIQRVVSHPEIISFVPDGE